MRRFTAFILLLSTLSFLATQASGLHLHAEMGGHSNGAHHELHFEQAYSEHHTNASSHVDVSVFEPAPVSTDKTDSMAPIFTVPAIILASQSESPIYARPSPPSDGHLRFWRPPLRAPPAHS